MEEDMTETNSKADDDGKGQKKTNPKKDKRESNRRGHDRNKQVTRRRTGQRTEYNKTN